VLAPEKLSACTISSVENGMQFQMSVPENEKKVLFFQKMIPVLGAASLNGASRIKEISQILETFPLIFLAGTTKRLCFPASRDLNWNVWSLPVDNKRPLEKYVNYVKYFGHLKQS
jgi:hypothetical protein